MIIFSNIEDALAELAEMAGNFPNAPFRVGTGEVIDSLSLDPLTLYSHRLIEFFRQYPKWTLELKTKSANVDHFLQQEHAGNVLVSWSVNALTIVNNEEHGTASLEQRLHAARRCADRNFPVAFHIDPMIWHEDWQHGYADLVDRILSNFSPDEVALISLGSLRFQPEQRHMMRERFGMESKVVQAEMFPSEGGKMRMDTGLRRQMFAEVMNRFHQHDSRWKIIMCMETPESWISAYNASPMKVENIQNLFRPLPRQPLPTQSAQVSEQI
jgi:spore photoproduct lyase